MPLWTTLATIGQQQLTDHVTEMAMKSPHPIRIGNVRYNNKKDARHRKTKSMYTKMQQPHGRTSNNDTTTTQHTNNTRVVMLQQPNSKQHQQQSYHRSDNDHDHNDTVQTVLLRANSLPKAAKNYGESSSKVQTMMDGTTTIAALPASAFRSSGDGGESGYDSINTNIGAHALQRQQQECPTTTETEDANHDSEEEDSESDLEEDPQRDPPSILDFMIAISFV